MIARALLALAVAGCGAKEVQLVLSLDAGCRSGQVNLFQLSIATVPPSQPTGQLDPVGKATRVVLLLPDGTSSVSVDARALDGSSMEIARGSGTFTPGGAATLQLVPDTACGSDGGGSNPVTFVADGFAARQFATTLTVPQLTTRPGDVLLMAVQMEDDPVHLFPPTNWSVVSPPRFYSNGPGTFAVVVLTKLTDGSEVSDYVVTFDTMVVARADVIAFRNGVLPVANRKYVATQPTPTYQTPPVQVDRDGSAAVLVAAKAVDGNDPKWTLSGPFQIAHDLGPIAMFYQLDASAGSATWGGLGIDLPGTFPLADLETMVIAPH